MKIENNGISPLTPKPTAPAQRLDKKSSNQGIRPANQSYDRTELSENARLLARSRAAMDGVEEAPESAQVQKLRSQVQDGTYQVQLESIAKRLMAGIFSKG
jgi:anti-sigma28 factor (negative regulator of flagellin synthesis)